MTVPAPRDITVREMIAHLLLCDPDEGLFVTTLDDEDLDITEMDLVQGYAYEDLDDEMSREIAHKRYGKQYLRRPILRVGPNE